MSMVIGIMSITAFAMMTVYMMAASHFASTRRVAMILLAMTIAEVAMFGLLSGVTNPTVMMLLVAARATILVVCLLAMRQDREAAKARARLRNRFRADLFNVLEPLRLVRRKQAAQHIDIVA